MTFGAGGHTKGLLDSNEQSVVYALDRDQSSIALAQQMAQNYPCESADEVQQVQWKFFE